MKYTLIAFFTFCSCIAFTQTQFSGTIETPEKDTLIGGQFAIYSVEDTSFIKGDIIEDNQFEFSHGKNPFFIKIFAVAYKDSFILVTPDPVNGKYTIPRIQLVSKGELQEVTVRAARPMFKRSLKGINVNVASTPLAELATLFDVLKASPKIMSSDDESITIIGKGTPKIFVDRQEILSIDELKAIPASFVDKIDIVTNPSARYSASGAGGVIEVYTLNYHMEGTVTTVGLNGGVNIVGQPNIGANVNLNFKKKKFSLNLSLNGSYSKYKSLSDSRTEYTDSSQIITNSSSVSRGQHFWGYTDLKMRYDFNKKHSLTAGIKGWGGGNTGVSDESSDFTQFSVLNQTSSGNTDGGNLWINPTAHLNYKWNTNEYGSYFTTRFQYNIRIRDGNSINNSAFQNYLDSTATNFRRKTDSRDRPNVFTTYIDYVHVFDTTGWEIGTGGFYSGLINDKIYDQYNFEDNDWVKDNTFSNSYDYTEQIAALYFDVEKSWEKFSFKLGVRSEATFINGFSRSLNKQIIDTYYINLFPSSTFMFQLSKDWNLTLGYNGRIDRPQFENYDPFVQQRDSLSITYGNPNLLPEYSHVASMELGYKMGYSLEASYTRTNRPISTRSFVDSNTYIFHSTPDNADYSDEVSLSLSIPINLKWWRGYNTLWGSYSKYYFPEDFYRSPFGNFTFGAYLYQQFFLPKDWSINTSLNVNSNASGNSLSKPNFYWNLGIGKKLLDGDLNLRLDVNNIIPPKYRNQIYGANYVTYSNTQWSFTTFKVSITYKFGRLKAVSQIEDAKKGGQSDRL